jgi:hypothetical protein
MRTTLRIAALAAAGVAAALPAQQLGEPFRIEAEGKPIEVDVGHAAPYLYDWDGDGVRDLLVGQFGEGKLRIYPNRGTDHEPRFTTFDWFLAGGEVARVKAS